MGFKKLGLAEPLLRSVGAEGYTCPTPIQTRAIPALLAGKDILGCAQTGTGKTAAFALPILHMLNDPANNNDDDGKQRKGRPIRALVLTPTRELASQIWQSFVTYGQHTSLKQTAIFGGVRQGAQCKAINAGVDIVVATPGRLMDLMGQGVIKLKHVEIFVLDEADRMLDMGFINDVHRIAAELPSKRQTMLFSATMPAKIQSLAESILVDPVDVRIDSGTRAAETVDHLAYMVENKDKQALLEHLLGEEELKKVLIFTATKRRADRVAFHLTHADIDVDVIHSDKTQSEREDVLRSFKGGNLRVLVASDIAARGIDVEDISHVINFELPEEPEVYVHRIGRTGRAGADGTALSFCGLSERWHLTQIEKLIGKTIDTNTKHPFNSPFPRRVTDPSKTASKRPRRNLLRRRRR